MRKLLNTLFCIFLVGCASNPSSNTTSEGLRKNDAIAQVLDADSSPKESNTERTELNNKDIENLTIDKVIRIEEPNTQNLYDDSRYDFPITVNARVEGWIDYFTHRGRHHMDRYLSRSSRYLPLMKDIFKKSGLPEDLVFLALIESGFNLKAKSRARAVGPWQFMKATGKRYGLRVDSWMDERRDPVKATEAAAAYLKDLYLMFESWYLAASAYNAGEYKILRAIEELKTNNYWRISQTKLIRRETKDYIPKLIAAAIIAKNPKKYGFEDISYMEPYEFDTIDVAFPIKLKELAKSIDVSEDDIFELNPAYLRSMVPPAGGTYTIRVPVGARVLVERKIASLQSEGMPSGMPIEYRVNPGDTLSSISRRYKIGIRELAQTNNLGTRERLSPGSTILIPNRSAREQREPASVRVAQSQASGGDFVIHVVRKGDSLWSISEQYDVTVQNIFQWNNLKRSEIFPGKRLKIKSRTNASDSSLKPTPTSSARS